MTTQGSPKQKRIVVQQISDITISISEGETPRIPVDGHSSISSMALMGVNFMVSGSPAAFLFFNPGYFGDAVREESLETVKTTLRNLLDKKERFRIVTDPNKPLVVVIKRDNNDS